MTLSRSSFLRAAAALLLVGVFSVSGAARASDGFADLAVLYGAQVDARLAMPTAETRRYAQLAEEALTRAGVGLAQPQYVAVVDRDPWVQAFLLLWRSAPGQYELVGASPVSTGRPGSFDHFETPLGVFEHTVANPDYRALGTPNSGGIRGYGMKGLRIFDFGWQRAPKGWGDGAVSEMRLQMHATDPDLLERRLGSAQSKGCIRIPATLNRFLDHFGVLDAAYQEATHDGSKLWMLDPQRQPAAGAGRYLLVVESGRGDRPDWSPAPFIPHRPPAPPAPGS